MSDQISAQASKFLGSLDTAIDQMLAKGETPARIQLNTIDRARFNAAMSEVHGEQLRAFSYRDIPITSGEVSQVESD